MTWPPFTQDTEDALLRVMKSRRWVEGAETELLEEDLRKQFGTTHAVAMSNGTAAIAAGLFAMGVGRGDSVLVPALGFPGTVLPLLMLGAVPLFYDVDPHTFNARAEYLNDAWDSTREARVAIVVHLHGLVSHMSEIMSWCDSHDVAVFEDNCQSPGAQYMGELAGTMGVASALSFNHTKPIPAGEGGVLLTSDYKVAAAARSWRMFGEDPTPPKAQRVYTSFLAGTNAKITEWSAAVAREQLTYLDARNDSARLNAAIVIDALTGSDLTLPVPDGYDHTYHKFRVRGRTDVFRNAKFPATRWVQEALVHHNAFFSNRRQIPTPNAIAISEDSWFIGAEFEPWCDIDNWRASEIAEQVVEVL